MPFNLGFGEILVVLVVALLLFGGRLPEVGRSLGRGLREFREGMREGATRDGPAKPETPEESEPRSEGEGEEKRPPGP